MESPPDEARDLHVGRRAWLLILDGFFFPRSFDAFSIVPEEIDTVAELGLEFLLFAALEALARA